MRLHRRMRQMLAAVQTSGARRVLDWRRRATRRATEDLPANSLVEQAAPDRLLGEVRRVLVPDGRLVVSTPNLVCWANPVLVPLDLQPLFTETSSRMTLGRRFRALGQDGRAQGHLKLFTHRSLAEILERHGFELLGRRGLPFDASPWPVSVLDAACARRVPLAWILLYVARRR